MNTFKQNKGIALFVGACGLLYLGAVALTAVPSAKANRPDGSPSPEQLASSRKIDVQTSIRNRCFKDWGDNFRMVEYCIEKQTESAQNLGL